MLQGVRKYGRGAVAVVAEVRLMAAIIEGKKRKVFYGGCYGIVSTVACEC